MFQLNIAKNIMSFLLCCLNKMLWQKIYFQRVFHSQFWYSLEARECGAVFYHFGVGWHPFKLLSVSRPQRLIRTVEACVVTQMQRSMPTAGFKISIEHRTCRLGKSNKTCADKISVRRDTKKQENTLFFEHKLIWKHCEDITYTKLLCVSQLLAYWHLP